MKGLSVSKLLPHVFVLTILLAWPVAESATSPAAVRADLTHVDSGRGFTKRELLHRMAARSKARVASLCVSSGRPSASGQAVTAAPVAGGSGEYLLHFGIGTPRPQRVALTLDTGSDLIWTQCACETCFNQTIPVLDPSASGTIRGVPCSDPLCRRPHLRLSWCAAKDNSCFYVHDYADRSITAGKIFEDTFTFRAPHGGASAIAAVPNVRFGCGMHNTGVFQSNETGIAGFGRGPLSLPSQLKVSRFSYCFTPFLDSKTSPVFLGAAPDDNLEAHATGPVQSTPFAPGPEGSPSYYISLQGITVGKTRLAFDASAFVLNGDGPGAGGTIIDSGTGITTFPEPVYRSIREAFVTQVPLPADDSNGMLCFSVPPKKKKAPEVVPKLVLHLEGAEWEVPPENYVLDFEVEGYGGALCVMIQSAGESDVTTIGNYLQQNTHIAYDLESNKMSFVPAQCDKL